MNIMEWCWWRPFSYITHKYVAHKMSHNKYVAHKCLSHFESNHLRKSSSTA